MVGEDTAPREEMTFCDGRSTNHGSRNMISKKIAYTPPTEYLFLDQKRKAKVIDKMKRNIAKLDIKPEDVGFVIT